MAIASCISFISFSSSTFRPKLDFRNCSFTPPILKAKFQKNSTASTWVSALSPAVSERSTPPITSFNKMTESLINRVDLSESEAEASLDFLLNDANEALISAFLVLLRAKGETYEEVLFLGILSEFIVIGILRE